MSPFRIILFAADFSQNSREAFRSACSLAAEGGARLYVLHVVEPDLVVKTPDYWGQDRYRPAKPVVLKWATMRLDERLRQSFCISMNPRRMFRPDLNDCGLEDRLAPVIANLGVIVLTTGGYMLLIPFPGAYVSPASPGSSSGPATASSVSGVPINTTLMPPAGSLPGSFPGGPTPILPIPP